MKIRDNSLTTRRALFYPGSFEAEWKVSLDYVKFSEENSLTQPQEFCKYQKYLRIFLQLREPTLPKPNDRSLFFAVFAKIFFGSSSPSWNPVAMIFNYKIEYVITANTFYLYLSNWSSSWTTPVTIASLEPTPILWNKWKKDSDDCRGKMVSQKNDDK